MKFVKIPKVEVLTLDLAMAKEYENNNEFDYFDIEEIQKERLARGEWEQQLADSLPLYCMSCVLSTTPLEIKAYYEALKMHLASSCPLIKVKEELERQAKEDKQGEIKK